MKSENVPPGGADLVSTRQTPSRRGTRREAPAERDSNLPAGSGTPTHLVADPAGIPPISAYDDAPESRGLTAEDDPDIGRPLWWGQ